ncbi:MAG: hypothetical protein MJA84_15660 [Firmicutes bacterium]|nr:hypothetical protein [Bacillota bacterium]
MEFERNTGSRKADVQIRFSNFDLPPMQDVLLIGRRAPIGPEAARKMVEAVAPGQYEIILVEDNHIEAVAVKANIFSWISRDILIKTLLEEGSKLTNAKSLVKAKLNISISVHKEVDI